MKPQPEDTQERKTPISDSLDDKIKLTRLVAACYEALNVYGKSPEQLEASIMLMQMTLGRFDYEKVRDAFSKYLQYGATMPTPADIIKIIEPPVEPRKWCGATFVDIKRRTREGQFITNAENKYCEDFIQARIKEPDNAGIIDDAMRQVERQNKQCWLEG